MTVTRNNESAVANHGTEPVNDAIETISGVHPVKDTSLRGIIVLPNRNAATKAKNKTTVWRSVCLVRSGFISARWSRFLKIR